MKILWVTNTIFPVLAKMKKISVPTSGGWMYALADSLCQKNNIDLVIATVHNLTKLSYEQLNNVSYYLIPSKNGKQKYDQNLENEWRNIINTEKPDIVHIHGTEYSHGLALMNACPKLNYVISIQGLIHVISRYYAGGISKKNYLQKITLKDIVLNNSIFKADQRLKTRGIIENCYIRKTTNVIGRTNWDRAHTLKINPKLKYFHCHEVLRPHFYKAKKWDSSKCNKHTIFLSQANYPLKGAHKAIESLEILLKRFPQTTLRISGTKTPFKQKFYDTLKMNGYQKYLTYLIKKKKLRNHITFLGPLDELGMIKEYQNCNVFVCPSSIENSPNSLAEAQILGVPCVASYAGGIPDMVTQNKTGILYRFEEIEMLAQAIDKIFSNSEVANNLSKQSVKIASSRHNQNKISNKMISIYEKIITQNLE